MRVSKWIVGSAGRDNGVAGGGSTRGVAMILALLMLGMSSASRGELLLYEGFDYGATDGNITGKGGSELGLTGTWSNNEGSYEAAGLTFSDLVVAGGLVKQAGGMQLAARQLAINPTGALYGSFLFRAEVSPSTAR
jgi:hypothetical protein